MAITKTVLKNTSIESVVKIQGTDGLDETIDLDVDLVSTGQIIEDGSTQIVNIVGLVWTGHTNALITLSRGGVIITTLQANAAGALDFSGQFMIPETVNNTHNIRVDIDGVQAEVWIRLKKISGYTSTIEYEKFGAYDDPDVFGS